MVLPILYATTIFSVTNTFMTTPSWMESCVVSNQMFGSSSHTGSGRITASTISAVESIFDAYYERLYFFNASGIHDTQWDRVTFGTNDFRLMRFDIGTNQSRRPFNYRNGDRTVPDTRRIVEYEQVFGLCDKISELVDSSYSYSLYRDNWINARTSHGSAWSSSKIGYDRTPREYTWTASVPILSLTNACKTICACQQDTYIHTDGSFEYLNAYYPVCMMFYIADSDYYYHVVEPALPASLTIDSTIPSLIEGTFGSAGAWYGLDPDFMTRKFVKDCKDYGGGIELASTLSVLSQTLAILDRTYTVPQTVYDATITNVVKNASMSETYLLEAPVEGIEISVSYGESTGTFTCDYLTDEDLGSAQKVSAITNNYTSFVMGDNKRDRVRFGGMISGIRSDSSSITTDPSQYHITVGSILGSEVPAVFAGTNRVRFAARGSTVEGDFVLSIESLESETLNRALFNQLFRLSGVTANFHKEYTISRTSRSSWSVQLPLDMVSDIIDDEAVVPCGSAYDTGRVGEESATASMLGFACRYNHEKGVIIDNPTDDITYEAGSLPYQVESQVVRHSIVNYNLPAKTSLRTSAYYGARSSARDFIDGEMTSYCGSWKNPLSLCDLGDIELDNSNPGSYVGVSGGQCILSVYVNGVMTNGNYYVSVVETGGSGTSLYSIDKIGYETSSGQKAWFDGLTEVGLMFKLLPDEEGTGFKLSQATKDDDMAGVSIDAHVVPLVTTDWKWKSAGMK